MITTLRRIQIAANLLLVLFAIPASVAVSQQTPRYRGVVNLCRDHSSQIEGDIRAGQVHRYTLIVENPAGQVIDLLLKAQSRPSYSIHSANGSVVATQLDDSHIALRSGGDYVLESGLTMIRVSRQLAPATT